MQEAQIDGKTVAAGLDSPDAARCPACGVKRQRRRMDGSVVYYYRHLSAEQMT